MKQLGILILCVGLFAATANAQYLPDCTSAGFNAQFIITNPGALGKHLRHGDVLRRIDGQRVTIETLTQTFARKPQSVQFYTPGVGRSKNASLAP
jgi:hypothetical protein